MANSKLKRSNIQIIKYMVMVKYQMQFNRQLTPARAKFDALIQNTTN